MPLSHAQEGMWLIYQLDPASAAYHNVLVIRLEGPLEHGILERSINEIIRRHEPLRATFATVDGAPTQLIAPSLRLTIPVIDAGLPGHGDPLDAALQLAAEEARRPFDLAAGPPGRAVLLRLSAEDHLLVVTIHHISSDGGSMTIFMTELLALYTAFAQRQPSPLSELPVSYTQFISMQRDRLSGDRLDAGTSYWKQRLAGSPTLLELPADRPRPPKRSGRGAVHTLNLAPGLTDRVRKLGRQERATLFMTVLAAFQVLLCRYSGQRDILVGAPMTHRVRNELRGMMGYLANTIVLRTTFTSDVTFRELLGNVRQTAIGAYAHADVPFEKVVQALRPYRALSHHPIFQVVLSFHESLGGPLHQARFSIADSGIQVSFPRLDVGTSRLDLSLCVHEGADELGIDFEYGTDLFDAATVSRMAACFTNLLTSIVSNPDERVSRLRMLPPSEDRRAPPARERPGARGGFASVHDHIDRAVAALGKPRTGGWNLPLEIGEGVTVGTSEDLLAVLPLSGSAGSWPRMMICVGEPPLPGAWGRRLERAAGLTLASLYGPPWTALVTGSAAQIPPGRDHGRLIGRALAGQLLEVLDDQRQPVPAGVSGRLYAGDQSAGLVASGDVARQWPDGWIELLGTLAARGELGGVPILPCVIETTLGQHPLVGEAAVAVRADYGSESRLIAYVVPEPGARPSVSELREFLRRHLASYVVPAQLILVNRLPRTVQARIDRAALLPPERPEPPVSSGQRTAAELALAALRRQRQAR